MKTFICKTCNNKFEAEGSKEEWVDPIYGPCTKFTAPCPCNGSACEEYRPSKTSKDYSYAPSAPSCGSGGCCCGN